MQFVVFIAFYKTTRNPKTKYIIRHDQVGTNQSESVCVHVPSDQLK